MTTNAASTNATKPGRPGTLRVGTAGWAYDTWRGPFYPPATRQGEAMLDAYQQHLRTVENNGTCHRMPTPKVVKLWREHCGPGFQMAVKMVQTVTHRLGESSYDTRQALEAFANHVSALGEFLGPILLQFPRTKQVTVEMLQEMAQIISGSKLATDVRIAVEIRHAGSSRDPSILQLLRQLGWCWVMHPNSIGRSTVARSDRAGMSESYALEPLAANDNKLWPITAKTWTYIRLHGTNDEHSGCYADEQLTCQAVNAMVSWLRHGVDVYAYTLCDNDAAGMAKNAMRLEQLCHEQLGTVVPRAPKQVRTITSFFTSTAKRKRNDERERPQTKQKPA